jgi:hypothetical protein
MRSSQERLSIRGLLRGVTLLRKRFAFDITRPPSVRGGFTELFCCHRPAPDGTGESAMLVGLQSGA